MKELSSSQPFGKAKAGAEVAFRKQERKGNWSRWHDRPFVPGIEREIPPHWQAAIEYAARIISAYGAIAMGEFQDPDEFESFLRQCEWIVCQTTYDSKLQRYDQPRPQDVMQVKANFHVLVSAAVAEATGDLECEAWCRHEKRLEEEAAKANGTAHARRPRASKADADEMTPPPNREELARDREPRLQGFVTAHDTTIAAVCEAAMVHKADMQRWRRGELADDSIMSQRIEEVLSGKRPIKAGGTKAANSVSAQ